MTLPAPSTETPPPSKLFVWLSTLPFLSIHLACFAILLTGSGIWDWALCAACYFVRMFGITAGYHRYFAHRSYKTSRTFQFMLAWLGCSALQKGPLWWTAHHRHHHRFSDLAEDRHSPHANSFWWSHIGWVLTRESEQTNWSDVRDWVRYPELRFLNRFHWVPGIVLAGLCFLVGGWSGLVVGFFISTTLLYHGVFTVNSICHILGKRRYATQDKSRNNLFVALITLGEGWHNNHHHYQSSTRQGFFWWEIDVTYYILKLLALMGVVRDLRQPPPAKVYHHLGGKAAIAACG